MSNAFHSQPHLSAHPREVVMIQVNGLKKRFGPTDALSGMEFSAPNGAITAILGANGAGKTSTIRIITGLMRADAGSVAVDGIDPAMDRVNALRRLGVLPDDYGVYERLTAREHIEHVAAAHGLSGAELRLAVEETLASLDMRAIADRRVHGFSLGERMKVALGSAIVHRPSNLLLDEPTRGLDVFSVRMLRGVLIELRKRGVCILLASHVMSEVQRLADRVVVVAKGRAVASGTPAQLLATTGAADMEDAFMSLATGSL
jgi:sodium transport system ATP-binding protein